MIPEFLSALLIGLGLIFFIAGTLGLLRFPDTYTRIHAVTKADTVGLGMVCAGVALWWGDWLVSLKLLLLWLLVLLSSALLSHLIAAAAMRAGIRPWEAE